MRSSAAGAKLGCGWRWAHCRAECFGDPGVRRTLWADVVCGAAPPERNWAADGAGRIAGPSASVILVCVGLYGLMSYAVQRRRSEIGLRMALGALPGRVLR